MNAPKRNSLIGLGSNVLLIPAAAWIGFRIRSDAFFEIGPIEDLILFSLMSLSFLCAAVFVSLGFVGGWRKEKRFAIGCPVLSVLIAAASAGTFSLAAGSAEPLLYLWRLPAFQAVPYSLIAAILLGVKVLGKRR